LQKCVFMIALICMRTTLDIDDRLLVAAKKRAAEGKTSLTKVIEEALRGYLSPPRTRRAFKLELVIKKGKLRAGIDVADRDALYDRMEGRS
jgi:hypothetical protein